MRRQLRCRATARTECSTYAIQIDTDILLRVSFWTFIFTLQLKLPVGSIKVHENHNQTMPNTFISNELSTNST